SRAADASGWFSPQRSDETLWRSAAPPISAYLAIHGRHVGVAVAGRFAELVELREILGRELDLARGGVLLEVRPPPSARNGNDVVAAREHPRDRDLRRRCVLRLRDLLDALGELHVALEVLALEARVVAPEVVVVQLVRRGEATGEEAAAEWAVRDEPDAELAQRVEDVALEIARPDRVLRLQRGDRVHGMRAPDRLGRRLREAEVTHLPGGDELSHRADRLLDRRQRVDAVLVVEVDVVGAETPERPLDRRADGLGAPVRPAVAERADELRRHHELVTTALDRPADELLVRAASVHLGRVEERDPELERPVDGRDRFRVVAAPAVEGRHPHAPEPLLRYGEPLSERPFLHGWNVAVHGTSASLAMQTRKRRRWLGHCRRYTARRSWPSPRGDNQALAAISGALRTRSRRRR